MPPEEQGLDLEQLKVDPRVWQRLATPLDGSNVLGNVFVDEKENPFQKDPIGSMEKIQSLAAAGKLYLRDLGRSRHFHKVEKDGDNLKLGEKHEMKLSNRNIDLPLSILMWATGKYLRSWGLERIPNWFDKKREERAAINKMEAQYKEEFKSFTKEQKKELKDLRKQEKQEAKQKKQAEQQAAKQAKQEAKLQKKLDKLKKEAEKAQQKLDKLKNKDKKKTEEKAKKKTKKKTGRKNKKEIKEKETDPLTKAIEKEAQELQDFLDAPDIEKEVKELEDFLNPPENPNRDNETGPLIEEEPHPDLLIFDDDVPQTNLNAPLENPPDLESGQVNMQPQNESPEQAALRNRLIEEKEAIDAVANWRDTVANSLFHDGEGTVEKTIYDKLKGNDEAEFDYLSSAVFGLLAGDAGGPENKQQIMDKLLNGQPLGRENNHLIMDGIIEYEKQTAKLNTKEGREAFAQTLADVSLELSKQASRETNLSPRHMMIGRLISNAMTIADQNKLELPLKEEDWTIIRGAFHMANLSQDYHNARQYLGANDANLNSEKGRSAVNSLLAGQAVEKMLQRDHLTEHEIKNTQVIMGYSDTWSSKNLQEMVNHSEMRKRIGPEQVKTLLEEPNGLAALDIGKNLSQEMIAEYMGLSGEKDLGKQAQMEKESAQQTEMENQQQIEQPNVNLFNPFG